MGARGKDEVLPHPDGSILSGGTVFVWNAFDTQWVSAILIHVLPTKTCQEKTYPQFI